METINTIEHLQEFLKRTQKEEVNYWPYSGKKEGQHECKCKYDKNEPAGYCSYCKGWKG